MSDPNEMVSGSNPSPEPTSDAEVVADSPIPASVPVPRWPVYARLIGEAIVLAVAGVLAERVVSALTGSRIGAAATGGLVAGLTGLLFLRAEKNRKGTSTPQELRTRHD